MTAYCPTCCHGSLYISMFMTPLLALAGPMAAYSGYRIYSVDLLSLHNIMKYSLWYYHKVLATAKLVANIVLCLLVPIILAVHVV